MNEVKAKKYLGQHFLTDLSIARRITDSLTGEYRQILEVGPGMGVLTRLLLEHTEYTVNVVEIDTESVSYLYEHFPALQGHIHATDFLRMDFSQVYTTPFALIGNFPYNISSQILIKTLENRDMIPEVVGMFQKEVAVRIASAPGNKDYGILSVLLQAYYDIEYLFTVNENVFNPPPKVKSAVIRLKRNNTKHLDCDEQLYKTIVKTAFNQRRKMLRNSLKGMPLSEEVLNSTLLEKRPEDLGVQDYIYLAQQCNRQ